MDQTIRMPSKKIGYTFKVLTIICFIFGVFVALMLVATPLVFAQNTTIMTANYNSTTNLYYNSTTGQTFSPLLSQFEQLHNSSNSKTNNLFIPNHKGDLTPDELKHQQAICAKAFKTNPYTAILIGCTHP
jgi:hypothetical protein